MGDLDVGQGAKVYFRLTFFDGALAIDVTQTTVSLFAASILVIIIGLILGHGIKKRPGRKQALTEKIVLTLYDLVGSTMGKHNLKYAPFVGTLFLSSLFGSLIGLTKIFRSTTADLMVVLGWALVTTGICWYEGIRNKGFFGWLKGFGEPIVFIAPINIISEIAQPVSMAFRHFGNIAGGGVLMTIVYAALSAVSTLVFRGLPAAVASVMPPVFQIGIPAILSLYFDLFSGLIQAFVFSLLTMVYIASANPPPRPKLTKAEIKAVRLELKAKKAAKKAARKEKAVLKKRLKAEEKQKSKNAVPA